MRAAYIATTAPVLVCVLWVAAWNTLKGLVQP